MALTGALFSGVSGINSNGNALNIIGDNIANVNTVGFKSARPVFFDLLSVEVGGTKIGTGSRLATASRVFVQGGIETTNSSTDVAIQGRGMFVLRDAQGGTFYSRAGQFGVSDDGNLVNPSGLLVQGIRLDLDGNPTSGVTGITLGQSVVEPTETTTMSMVANLDATAAEPVPAMPADAGPAAAGGATSDIPGNWFGGSNFSTVITVYDSLGQGHDLTVLFRKTANPNEWDYRVVANAADITGGTPGELEQVSNVGGLLAFNADGTLDTANTVVTEIGPIAWANGGSSQTIPAAQILFDGTTQFALPSSVSTLAQDGSRAGVIKGINIGEDGVITGLFTTGGTRPLYRLALGDFTNPEGLTHIGNSLFVESTNSGPVLLGSPADGSFGTVLSGSLELSTVDLATEFVKMVTTQRGFQASSRTITVTDTLLEEVANLKR